MRFVKEELNFNNTRVVSQNLIYQRNSRKIEVSLFGEFVPQELIENANRKLQSYNLQKTELVVLQGYNPNKVDLANLRSGVIEELYRKNELIIRSKDDRIRLLEQELADVKAIQALSMDIGAELRALYPTLADFSINQNLLFHKDKVNPDTVYLAYVHFTKKPPRREVIKLEDWLKARVKSIRIKLISQ
jgi:hypothetical protein